MRAILRMSQHASRSLSSSVSTFSLGIRLPPPHRWSSFLDQPGRCCRFQGAIPAHPALGHSGPGYVPLAPAAVTAAIPAAAAQGIAAVAVAPAGLVHQLMAVGVAPGSRPVQVAGFVAKVQRSLSR